MAWRQTTMDPQTSVPSNSPTASCAMQPATFSSPQSTQFANSTAKPVWILLFDCLSSQKAKAFLAGYVSTIVPACLAFLWTSDGALYGARKNGNELVRIDGAAASLAEVAADFARETLLPSLGAVLPKGVLQLVAGYAVLCPW